MVYEKVKLFFVNQTCALSCLTVIVPQPPGHKSQFVISLIGICQALGYQSLLASLGYHFGLSPPLFNAQVLTNSFGG